MSSCLKSALALVVGLLAVGRAEATVYWWENAECVKEIALGTTGQQPARMGLNATGRRLVVATAAGDDAQVVTFAAVSLARRKGTTASLSTQTAAAAETANAWKDVATAQTDLETQLLEATGVATSSVARAQVTQAVLGAPYFTVFGTNGVARVFALAEDGQSLASTTPVATVDLFSTVLTNGYTSLTAVTASADGQTLFAAPAVAESAANKLCVVRSGSWGLVDAVATIDLFPWRNDNAQLSRHNETTINPLTINDASVCWADAAIYKKISYYPTLTDTFSNLTAADAYRAEYHYAENCRTAAGQRVSTLTLNGVSLSTNFDHFVEAGGVRVACVRTYDTTATSAGQIVFKLDKVVDQPIISGMAIWGQEPPSALTASSTFTADGTSGSFTWSAKDTLAYYLQSAPSRTGPWTTILRDQVAKKSTVTCAAGMRTFYRVVASNGVGTVSSYIIVNRPEKFPVYSLNCGFEMERVGRFVPESHHIKDSHAIFNPHFRLDGTILVAANENPDDVPSEVGRSAIRPGSPKYGFEFRNLRSAKTYELRLFTTHYRFARSNESEIRVTVNGTVVASGIQAYDLVDGDGLRMPELVFDGLVPTDDGVIRVDFANGSYNNIMQLAAIELLENESDRVPLVPVVEVFARHNGNHVSIKPGTGDLTYEIRRRATADGEYETVVAGATSFSWVDAGAASGMRYSVRATSAEGKTSDWSADLVAASAADTPERFVGWSPQYNVTYANAKGNYYPYINYTGARGRVSEATHAYSHDLVIDPAPADLYKHIMWFNNGYFTVTNLYPNANYLVRVHNVESFYTARGKRVWERITANEHDAISGSLDPYQQVGKGVYVTEGVARTSPDGWMNIFMRASTDNIDMATAEFILLEGAQGEAGVATAVQTGETWQKGTAANCDLNAEWVAGTTGLWDAHFSVPVDGTYTFSVAQTGAYALWIDDANLLRPTGGAAATGNMMLTAGEHRLRAQFIAEQTGAAQVALTWSGPTFEARTLAAPALTLPQETDITRPGWFSTDSGSTVPGDFYKLSIANDGSDVWRLTASGAHHWKGVDQGHFTYQVVPGSREFDAVLRVRRFNNPLSGNMFGLEIRPDPSTDPTVCSYSWMSAVQPYWSLAMAGDDYTDGIFIQYTYFAWDSQTLYLPLWLKVEYRHGGTTGRHAKFLSSVDGVTWQSMGEQDLPRTARVCVGPRHAALTNKYLTSVDFDNFSLTVYPSEGTLLILR